MDKNQLYIGINCEIQHEACEYFYGNGYKNGTKTGYVGDGFFASTDGYGWGITMKPSKLTLRVDVNDKVFDVWIDQYFKSTWGRLSEKRVNAIKVTMPQLSLLEERMSKKGTKYYVLAENYLNMWLKFAKCYHKNGINPVYQFDKKIREMFTNTTL